MELRTRLRIAALAAGLVALLALVALAARAGRGMPGGGSVRVELLVSDRGNIAGERVSGRVVMDRALHADAIVVEEIEGDDPEQVVPELLRIARDNAAIARRVIRRRSELR